MHLTVQNLWMGPWKRVVEPCAFPHPKAVHGRRKSRPTPVDRPRIPPGGAVHSLWKGAAVGPRKAVRSPWKTRAYTPEKLWIAGGKPAAKGKTCARIVVAATGWAPWRRVSRARGPGRAGGVEIAVEMLWNGVQPAVRRPFTDCGSPAENGRCAACGGATAAASRRRSRPSQEPMAAAPRRSRSSQEPMAASRRERRRPTGRRGPPRARPGSPSCDGSCARCRRRRTR